MEYTIDREGFDQWMNETNNYTEKTVTLDKPYEFVSTVTDSSVVPNYWFD